MFNISRLWGSLGIVMALITNVFMAPGNAAAKQPSLPTQAAIQNIVLVHGAFADGSSWWPVMKILQRKGYNVTSVQNPLTSLSEDVAATRRVLERQHGDVILVGHSWAGAVVTEAGQASNVRGLVYLSALVPETGESVGDMLSRLTAPMEGLTPDKDGFIWLDDPSVYRHVMAADVSSSVARLLAASQQPISVHTFADKVTVAAWKNKPSWYLVTQDDNALPPRVQRKMAEQIGATTVTVKSSHMSLISHPEVVASLIAQAASSAGRYPPP